MLFLLFYKFILRLVLTYSAFAWASSSFVRLKALEAFQNRILRLIVKQKKIISVPTLARLRRIGELIDNENPNQIYNLFPLRN